MATSVGEIALDLTLNSESLESQVSDIANKTAKSTKKSLGFADSLNKVGGATSTVGTALVGLSAPITGLGIASTKSALTFEDSMAKVMTIADQSVMSYDDMKSAIMDLSDQTGISANEIADNVYNAISAGQETGDAVNFVSNSTKLAKAGFADAGSALDILTTILNAYGMEASEVTNVSDLLIQTQNKGKVTVGELSTAMGKVIPTANANNVALDQLCSGYAIMTANGVACAESTTYMNSMLNELGKSGTKVSDILKSETGMSFSECMASGMSLGDVLAVLDKNAKDSGLAFTDLWGSAEAGKAGLILLGDSGKEFNSMLGEMQASTGATQTAFETLDTTSYSMEKAINNVKNAGIQLGGTLLETLAPVILQVCDAVSSACKWFNSLDEGTKKTIFTVAGIVTAVGGVLVVFGKLMTGISSLITAISTIKTAVGGLKLAFTAFNPTVLIVVAVIGALIAIGVALYQNWDTIKEKLSVFAEYWKTGWQSIKDFFSQTWESIKSTAITIWNSVSEFFSQTWESIKTTVSSTWNSIKTTVSNTTTNIKTTISNVWNNIKTTVSNVLTAISTFISNIWNNIKTFISNTLNNIKTTISNIWNGIKTTVSNVSTAIKTTISNVWNTIKTTISTVLNGIKSVVTTVWNAIKSFISTIVNGIKSVVTTVWNGIKSVTSTVFNGIKSTITTIWNAIKSGVSTAIGGVKDKIVSGLEKAWDYIKSIPSKALQWGKDMIQGLIDGISSMIGKVGEKASEIAGKISSFLHFSCPDEGPLANYETWMPDFMRGLAKGIKANSGLVENAISDLSSTMQLGLETPELKNVTPINRNQTQTSENLEMFNKLSEMFNAMMSNDLNGGDIIIPVYVGGNAIDEIVVKAQDRRKLRSGGMA